MASTGAKLRGGLGCLAVVLIFLLFLSLVVETYEAIPDHAKFLVNESGKFVVPQPAEPMLFHPLPGDNEDPFPEFDAVVTWKELRKSSCPYHDYGLPDTPDWNDFVLYGRSVSLFRSMFFPPPSRWDEDGNWRY